MINAPQVVLDALNSGNFKYANIITINLGDAYGIGSDEILYLTDCNHEIPFNGNTYTPDNNLVELEGISRKASTGSDAVELVFGVTDENLMDVIRSERYINKPVSIERVIIQDGAVVGDFAIPVRTAWGLSHSSSGDVGNRTISLNIDSVLGDLVGNNGWFTVTSSHEQRYPNDLIMRHSQTVMTDEQQKKYTANFRGEIDSEVKPPALSKVYGYKNVECVPICMLKHRKTHTSYRHYFTTMIFAINIGECNAININSLKMDGDPFNGRVVSNNDRDVGGWSVRVRTPADALAGDLLSEENSGDLSFWFEGMDSSEKNRMTGMVGKGLTLLFVKNRNRDDWLSKVPTFTLPVEGAKVYDPRTGQTVFSRNPILQYSDFLKSTEYGLGKRGIPVLDSNISDLANHFDQIPDSIGNAGINSILIDVQVDTGEPLVDNMNIWMEGVRLYTSDYYGQFNVRVETKSSVNLVLDELDLNEVPDYESGEFTDRINQLTYSIKQLVNDTSPDANFGDLTEVEIEATFPPTGSQIHTDWLSEDGGIISFKSEQLNYVTVLEQAYYWCMVDSRISRQPRKMTIHPSEICWLTEVGDIIQLSSTVLDMTDDLWRVDEVAEDDGQIELSLVAYDENFYTPDPNAIPDPADVASPPTGVLLDPVSGLGIIEEAGLYYLNWTPLTNSNVSWYAVEIAKDGDTNLFIDNPRVAQPPLLLENLVVGDYQASVVAIGLRDEGSPSSLIFEIELPETPSISATAGNFTIEVIPSVTKRYLGSTFRLKVGTVNDVNLADDKGTSGAFTIPVIPDTTYYIWVRTENIAGESLWASTSVTSLNDPALLGEFLNISSLRLEADSQIFAFDDPNPVVPSVINLMANVANIDIVSNPLVWTTVPNVTLGGSGESRTLTSADFGSNDSVAITVATTSGSFSDTTTVLRLEGGGVNGQDSIVGFLTNESHTISADATGLITGNLSAAGGSFIVYKGILDVTTSCIFSIQSQSGVTASINETTGVYTINSMSNDEGLVTFRATYTGVVIDKVYSISKARSGQRGSVAITRDISGVAPPNDTQWSDSQGVIAITSQGLVPAILDRVTLYNEAEGFSETRFLDSDATTWLTVTQVVDGNLLVDGTIGAEKLLVDEIFAQNIDVTGRLSVGGGANRVIIDGTGLDPFSIVSGVSSFVFDTSGKIKLTNIDLVGSSVIDDPNLFSSSLWSMINGSAQAGTNPTGGSEALVNQAAGNLTTITKELTITECNDLDVIVSFKLLDYEAGFPLVNPEYHVRILRVGGTGNLINTTFSGTLLTEPPPLQEQEYTVTKNQSATDDNHPSTGSLTYRIEVTHNSGDQNNPLFDFSIAQGIKGGTSLTSIVDLSDTTITSPSDDEVLTYVGGEWINQAPTGGGGEIVDTPTNGETTKGISSNWAFDNVKTAVPTGAVFTDTTYSVGNGGLTQWNFTTSYKNKLAGIDSNANYITNNTQLTNGAGYITTSSLSGYATEAWVNSQGFITGWRPLGTTGSTACAGNDSRLSNSRPASDVYSWAKSSVKPTYTASEVNALSLTGTAADSSKLGGLSASSYAKLSGASFTGTISAPTVNATSALKYKNIHYREDIRVSLEKVCKIGSMGVAVGTFKSGSIDKKTHRWFIADEVDLVMPEVVEKIDGEIEALNYMEMLADAYAAIAALTIRIKNLEGK